MKPFFLSIGLVASAACVYANPVSVQTAQTVATHFLSNKAAGRNLTLQLTKSYPSYAATGQTALYVFGVNGGKGFVIVSGDDAVRPVLGYSTQNVFPAQVTNNEVTYWLNGYTMQISNVINHGVQATTEVAAEWNTWTGTQTGASGNTANKPTDVAPMLLSEWDQMNPFSGSGNSLYNNLCPTSAPTGCVATAMAQIMYFWQHPAVGTGSHSYNSSYGGQQTANFGATTYAWANMPPSLLNNPTATQKNAVAVLMYHCGVSVNMNYDLASNGGSGAWVIAADGPNCSENALKNYFGYKSTISGRERADYSDTQWVNMLEYELDHGRPVLYTGFGSLGGHAFDFDGYDNNDYFHINWGWSGQSDGYFVIDDLSPSVLGAGGGGGNFNNGQQALIMIEPAGSVLPPNPFGPDYPGTTSNSADLVLATGITQSDDTIVYNTAFSLTAKIKNQGTADFTSGALAIVAANVNNQNNMFLIHQKTAFIASNSTYTYNFSTTGNTELVAGTYEMAYLYDVSGTLQNPAMVGDGTAQNDLMLTVINATTPPPTGISDAKTDANNLNSYPNPANDDITLDWKGFNGKVTGVQLFNILGQEVYHSETLTGTNIRIAVSGFNAGNYTMRIVTDKGTFAKKIVVK